MAIDWGDIIGTAVSSVADYYVATPGGTTTGTYTPMPPVDYARATAAAAGAAPHCKRRRRRRLLTESDFNDLMRIATLPNKQNVAVALAKAVGRR